MNEPVVYFKSGCPFGIRLRMALTLHRVPHRSVRFRDDEVGAARVRAVNDGNEISPTVHVARRWLTNPSWRDVRDAASTPQRHAAPLRSHRRTWRSTAVLIATASMLLVGCGSDPSQTPATTSKAPAASELEGTWRTSSIAPRDAEATLRRQGLGKYVKDYRANAPFSTDTVLELSIEDGQWNLYGESGGQREPIDYDAEYTIDGDTVTFDHSDGSTTHRWTVDGDRLSLEWVKSTMPAYEGIPDEVFQTALYMTEPFTKQK